MVAPAEELTYGHKRHGEQLCDEIDRDHSRFDDVFSPLF